jgi:hypothetical protein
MSESAPTPSEAQAALAEANTQAVRVRHADHRLGWMLLAVAAIYLTVAAIMSTVSDPRRGGPVAGPAILAILLVGLIACVYVGLRIRAYSRGGVLLYFSGIAVFGLWNGIVVGVSIATRWWASTQPGYHFSVSAAVATVPLLVVGWLILRR